MTDRCNVDKVTIWECNDCGASSLDLLYTCEICGGVCEPVDNKLTYVETEWCEFKNYWR